MRSLSCGGFFFGKELPVLSAAREKSGGELQKLLDLLYLEPLKEVPAKNAREMDTSCVRLFRKPILSAW